MNSHHGSPKLDETPPPNFVDSPPMPKAPVVPIDTKLQSILQKRKASYQDQIHEMSELEQASQLSIAEIQTQGKTTRQEIMEGKRCKTALDIEHSCVFHAHDEAQHQH